MLERIRKRAPSFLVISSILLLTTTCALWFDALSAFENKTWDARLKAIADQGVDPRVKIIMVTQSDLDFWARERHMSWPWPREMYVPVMKFLEQADAKGVAFDLIFSEPSYYGPSDDESFGAGMRGALPVVNAVVLSESTKTTDSAKLEALRKNQNALIATNTIGELAKLTRRLPVFSSATMPVQQIVASSHRLGNVSARPDDDGIFRHARIAGNFSGMTFLSLPLTLYHATQGELPSKLTWASHMNRHGELVVRYHGPRNTYPTYPISEVIKSFAQLQNGETPMLPLNTFANSWVFIGVSAPGLMDLRPIPLEHSYPGVEYNATVLDNFLHSDFVQRASLQWNVLFAAVLILLAVGFSIFLQRVMWQAIWLAALATYFLVAGIYLAELGIWISMAVPGVAMVAGVIISLGYQYQREGRQHRFIKDAFKHYLSPEVIEQVLRNPESLALGGDRRELSIFFSDIQGFTTLSESIPPVKLVSLLNTYLTAMSRIILESGGTIDKYEGDAIIAFWNAPLEVPNHASSAVNAALECKRAEVNMRKQIEEEYSVQLFTRIGINTGTVTVGNFGSEERFDYTVIGDAVNLASRLEGLNKLFGTSILISDKTRQQLEQDLHCRKIADVRVVGKTEAITVYEPISHQYAKEQATVIQVFDESLELFEHGELNQAMQSFTRLTNHRPAQAFITRIKADLAAIDSGELDQMAWSPIWEMTTK